MRIYAPCYNNNNGSKGLILLLGWLNKLERKIGKYAIRNLMLYIVAINGLVSLLTYLLSYYNKELTILTKMSLDIPMVMQGEVWRLITFLFIPWTTSPIWLLFTLYFYYMVGTSLEHEWGSFKFNVYYLVGILGTIGVAFLGGAGSSTLLNLSLVLAFAYLFPNYQILMFFFIPVKIKYLAILYVLGLGLTILGNPLFGLITVLGSMINFILFFGKDLIVRIGTGRKVYYNRREFESKIPKDVTIHRCTICGRTEKDDRNLEFRYCSECEGDYEYCMEHLENHVHVKKEQDQLQ